MSLTVSVAELAGVVVAVGTATATGFYAAGKTIGNRGREVTQVADRVEEVRAAMDNRFDHLNERLDSLDAHIRTLYLRQEESVRAAEAVHDNVTEHNPCDADDCPWCDPADGYEVERGHGDGDTHADEDGVDGAAATRDTGDAGTDDGSGVAGADAGRWGDETRTDD